MRQVGLEWSVVGFGPINGAGSSDMLMHNSNTGAFEVYDITNNQLTSAAPMGQVGLELQTAGIAADSLEPQTHNSRRRWPRMRQVPRCRLPAIRSRPSLQVDPVSQIVPTLRLS